MNYEYILREIKLSKLTDTPMGDEATMLVKFWDELWADMKIKIDPIEGEIRCWKDDHDYYYFFQDENHNYLWCDYDKVWSFFGRDLGLNYDDTQELVQRMVGETLNCKVNTPNPIDDLVLELVGKTLNCKVNTPDWWV